jgi:hypothetical protein
MLRRGRLRTYPCGGRRIGTFAGLILPTGGLEGTRHFGRGTGGHRDRLTCCHTWFLPQFMGILSHREEIPDGYLTVPCERPLAARRLSPGALEALRREVHAATDPLLPWHQVYQLPAWAWEEV